jgi:hypothetical protein
VSKFVAALLGIAMGVISSCQLEPAFEGREPGKGSAAAAGGAAMRGSPGQGASAKAHLKETAIREVYGIVIIDGRTIGKVSLREIIGAEPAIAWDVSVDRGPYVQWAEGSLLPTTVFVTPKAEDNGWISTPYALDKAWWESLRPEVRALLQAEIDRYNERVKKLVNDMPPYPKERGESRYTVIFEFTPKGSACRVRFGVRG